MELTLELINQYLTEKIGDTNCSVCGVSKWWGPTPESIITNLPVGPLQWPKGFTLVAGGAAMPSVYVVCSNCGHVVLFAKGVVEAHFKSETEQ